MDDPRQRVYNKCLLIRSRESWDFRYPIITTISNIMLVVKPPPISKTF
jgi:hypothetical protein